jgi:hypothetical protein
MPSLLNQTTKQAAPPHHSPGELLFFAKIAIFPYLRAVFDVGLLPKIILPFFVDYFYTIIYKSILKSSYATNEIIIKTTQSETFPITQPLPVSKWRKAKGSRLKEKINIHQIDRILCLKINARISKFLKWMSSTSGVSPVTVRSEAEFRWEETWQKRSILPLSRIAQIVSH